LTKAEEAKTIQRLNSKWPSKRKMSFAVIEKTIYLKEETIERNQESFLFQFLGVG
jgi:hypothetical protein